MSKNGGEVGVQVVVRMVAKMGVRLVVTFFGTPRIFPPFCDKNNSSSEIQYLKVSYGNNAYLLNFQNFTKCPSTVCVYCPCTVFGKKTIFHNYRRNRNIKNHFEMFGAKSSFSLI